MVAPTRVACRWSAFSGRIGISLVGHNMASLTKMMTMIRFKSSVPSQKKNEAPASVPEGNTDIAPGHSKNQPPTIQEWQHMKHHVPGEAVQHNTLRDRIPSFPLQKETVPTLLPRPGVPQIGNAPGQVSFKKALTILKHKKAPELIYESEPHRLYFVASFCCAVMFTIYGLVLLEFAWFKASQEYAANENGYDDIRLKREFALTWLLNSILGVIALGAAYGFGKLPTRLVRRMWYLPGPVEHVRLSTYPLVPGRPTPLVTIPLGNLARNNKARVWTGKGFYGTADALMFFFVLKEEGPKTKRWIVDRKGFFWGDGRIMDQLFGRETVAESEAGVPYDAQFALVNAELKKQKQAMKDKYGVFWRLKMGSELVLEDVQKGANYIGKLKESAPKNRLPPKPPSK